MKQIAILFAYTLLLTICFPTLFPDLHLFFFAPFLIYAYYRQSKLTSLWLALLCGVIIDLLSSHTRFGFYALSYCLTTWILYNQKQHFFIDSLSTLPIMTFLFSLITTLNQALLLYTFGQGITLSWEWIGKDLLWMPILDGLYAGIAFSLPCLLLPQSPRRETVMFTAKDGFT